MKFVESNKKDFTERSNELKEGREKSKHLIYQGSSSYYRLMEAPSRKLKAINLNNSHMDYRTSQKSMIWMFALAYFICSIYIKHKLEMQWMGWKSYCKNIQVQYNDLTKCLSIIRRRREARRSKIKRRRSTMGNSFHNCLYM